MSKDEIEKLVEEEPVMAGLETGSDLSGATGDYFGIGLSNRHGLTEELPFDVMMLVLGSELAKRKLDMETVTALIADEHAKNNGCDNAQIDMVAKARREFMFRALDRLEFKDWDVRLAT